MSSTEDGKSARRFPRTPWDLVRRAAGVVPAAEPEGASSQSPVSSPEAGERPTRRSATTGPPAGAPGERPAGVPDAIGEDTDHRRDAGATSGPGAPDATDEQRQAIDELLVLYRPMMCGHVLSKFRHQVRRDQVDDLLQGFVTDKLLTRSILRRADQRKGKFRTYLLTSLDRYVISSLRARGIRRRGMERYSQHLADAHPNGMAATALQPVESDGDEVTWARHILNQVLAKMQAECRRTHPQTWQVFEARLLGPILRSRPEVPYSELVELFGFQSPMQAANALVTAKRMFRRLLDATIAEHADHEAAKGGIAALMAILGGEHD